MVLGEATQGSHTFARVVIKYTPGYRYHYWMGFLTAIVAAGVSGEYI